MALTLPPISPAEEAVLRRLPPPGVNLSHQGGSRLGPRGGASVEFHEHRPYRAGDEIRRIDWKTTARAGHPLVKVTREERARRALVALDVSASMGRSLPGAPQPRLFDALRYCQFTLHHHHLNGDAAGLATWGDGADFLLAPSTGNDHQVRLEAALAGWCGLPDRLEDPRPGAARPPIPPWELPPMTIHLVGDFEIPLSDLETGLRRLRKLRHEVRLIFILDPLLLHLDGGDPRGLVLVDGETGRRMQAPTHLGEDLARRVEHHMASLRLLAQGLGVALHVWQCRMDPLGQYAAIG